MYENNYHHDENFYYYTNTWLYLNNDYITYILRYYIPKIPFHDDQYNQPINLVGTEKDGSRHVLREAELCIY